ncbi:MAG: hypothetical protein Q8K65_03355 [Alphaproteobacteria bacterium]|nr:hypothetical protein [Alphaproteobacteria bacterium]
MTASTAAAQVDARVVDQALVASFMNAEPPKVWRADMAKLNTATLELRSDAGRFRLVMITQGGEEDVALFTTRDDGTAALQAVMHAMMGPPSTSAPAAVTSGAAAAPAAAPVKKGGFFKWLLKLFLWLVAIFVTLMILAGLFLSDKTGQLISAINPGDAPIVAPGTAVPADEFFR